MPNSIRRSNHKRQDSLPLGPGAKVFTYARDSGGPHQTASTKQQNAAYADVAARRGWVITEALTDQARPGSTTVGRKELDRLLAAATPGAADGVVFWSSARMARDVTDAQFIRATLRKRGYTLVYLTDDIPDMGMWTPLMEVAKDIQNAQYLDQLSKEVKRGHAGLLALGYVPMGKKAPPGYTISREQYGTHRDGAPMEGIRWVRDPERAARVTLAWQMRLEGHSYRAIHRATYLYVDARVYGRFFRNPIYKGVFAWGGRLYENFCEPYVTPAEWDEAQALGERRRSEHPRRLGNKHLLVGLLYCPVCGGRMSTRMLSAKSKRNRYTYYLCSAKQGEWRECSMPMVRADHLESRVVERVMAVYYDPAELQRVYTAWQAADSIGDTHAEQAELESKVEQGDREIANLLQLAKLGNFASVAAELAALESTQAARRDKLGQIERAARARAELPPLETLPAVAGKLQAAIEASAHEEARLLLAALVARIEINPDGSPHLTLRPPTRR